MRTPLVSVLMTAHNREGYIEEAIESVLASSYTHFELIVVDDGSKDRTVELARRYEAKDSRVKVVVNERNLGDYPNRNKAASLANGEYIKYVDSDDIVYTHCLRVMVEGMEKFPQAGWGLCSIPDPGRPYPVCLSPREAYLEHFNGYGHFDRAPGSVIIKNKSFRETGGFTGERMIGDYQLWFNLARKYPLVKMPRDLVWDRRHPEQESNSNYAGKYEELKREVVMAALNHPECPIERKELKRQGSSGMASLKGKIKNLIWR